MINTAIKVIPNDFVIVALRSICVSIYFTYEVNPHRGDGFYYPLKMMNFTQFSLRTFLFACTYFFFPESQNTTYFVNIL